MFFSSFWLSTEETVVIKGDGFVNTKKILKASSVLVCEVLASVVAEIIFGTLVPNQ